LWNFWTNHDFWHIIVLQLFNYYYYYKKLQVQNIDDALIPFLWLRFKTFFNMLFYIHAFIETIHFALHLLVSHFHCNTFAGRKSFVFISQIAGVNLRMKRVLNKNVNDNTINVVNRKRIPKYGMEARDFLWKFS
jgi:hypothetical protein